MIVIKFTAGKSPITRVFPNFHILKINRMTTFCNLFMERPSYKSAQAQIVVNINNDSLKKYEFCCDMFRYLYSYKVEEVGQAVCNTFIGQWFLFGIQTATRNCTRLHSLHRTSTPCSRQPVTHDRFTVWQMALPSTASLTFIPVIKHLTTRNEVCVTNSSRQVELSLNSSISAKVAQNSAVESEDCTSRLRLSCDERNCSTDQSTQLSSCDAAATPQTSTHAVKHTVDGSCMMSYMYSSFNSLHQVWTSRCVSSGVCPLSPNDSHTVSADCELGHTSSSLIAPAVHIPIKNGIESSELFDVTDNFPKSVTDTEECYLKRDFTPEILFHSVIETPTSCVLKKRSSSLCIPESSSLYASYGVPSDSVCYSCSNFSESATEDVYCRDTSVLHNCRDPYQVSQCKQLDDAADKCKAELVCAPVTCRCSTENEDDFSIITGISQLNTDRTRDGEANDTARDRSDQCPSLRDVQQQLNKSGVDSPLCDYNWLSYVKCDSISDCSLDTCPLGFTYKSNVLLNSSSPDLFKDT